MFGIDPEMLARYAPGRAKTPWMDMLAANRTPGTGIGNQVMPNIPSMDSTDDFGLGIPDDQGGNFPTDDAADVDVSAQLQQWVDEAFKDRASAA
jgi:hypothetical protein